MIATRLFAVPAVLVASVLAALAAPAAAFARTLPNNVGNDVSYAQCPSTLPASGWFGIVGVNSGIAWSANPCAASEYAWATGRSQPPAFYMNTANPGPVSSHWNLGGPHPASTRPAPATPAAPTTTAGTPPPTRTPWRRRPPRRRQPRATPGGRTYAANAADVQGGLDYLRSGSTPPGTSGGRSRAATRWALRL